MEIKRVGVDLAKRVFEVYGVDAGERRVLSRRLSREKFKEFLARLKPCRVVMEACGGAHYWARLARGYGHDARLVDARRVVGYRHGSKNDRNDARAICEAGGRPQMSWVGVKSEEQEAVLAVHRSREQAVSHRTAVANHIRGRLYEYGLALPRSLEKLRQLVPEVLEDGENRLPTWVRLVLGSKYEELCRLDEQVKAHDRWVRELAQELPQARTLMALSGVGPVTATAAVATIGEVGVFRNGRHLAAWLGLVPRQSSSGGKVRLGSITKRGDRYLRKLLVHGARSVLRRAGSRDDAVSRWAVAVKARRGFNVAAVALAAKQARFIWAVLSGHAPGPRRGFVVDTP